MRKLPGNKKTMLFSDLDLGQIKTVVREDESCGLNED